MNECESFRPTGPARPEIKAKQSLGAPMFNPTPRRTGILLDANEFRFPLPSRLVARVGAAAVAVDLRNYPDPEEVDQLKAKLARELGVEADCLALGVGSTEVLDLICRIFGERDHRVVVPAPSFPMYAHYANLNELPLLPIALENDFTLSPEVAQAMLSAPGKKIIYVCSPNNPTSRSIDRVAFEILSSDPSTILCIDEAYADYSDSPSFAAEAPRRENVIVARSLSKIGFAGCRFGYVVASSKLVHEIAKGALPFTVNSFTIRVAGIVVEEMASIREVIEEVKRERARLSSQLDVLPGFKSTPSEANFVLCAAPGDTRRLVERLAERHRIFVRAFGAQSRLRDYLRIAVGLPEEIDTFLRALQKEAY